MDTKAAIKFLRNHFRIGIYEKISLDVIVLIKQLDKKAERGEKFEVMWGDFKKAWKGYNLYKRIGRDRNVGYDVNKMLKEWEQKHFLKQI